ncbi:hypothetical protein [Amycolatopsis sp. lyj-23]|uniref:hypothetical protein n=1 Tax=Amycolatopsis sp. lyj-23 TaxID=2789283 RepID=UPI00397D1E07
MSSTWGPRSLFGRFPDLIARLLAELDLEENLVCAALHPNIWFAHGPAQIRLWLGDCLRAGLHLVPPVRGWQQALLAADVVVGDHGAVTGYAAAMGMPTLLATFPEDDVVAQSAIGALGRTAPRLDQHAPLAPQLRHVAASPQTVRDLVTSTPGESAVLLRRTFYALMDLPEPAAAPLLPAYRASDLRPLREDVRAWWAVTEIVDDRSVRAGRWPADVTATHGGPPESGDGYLVVAYDHPRRDLYALAAVVLVPEAGAAPAEVFATHPVCHLVIQRQGGACRVTVRDGATAVVEASEPGLAETASAALLPWFDLHAGSNSHLDVLLGSQRVHLTVH